MRAAIAFLVLVVAGQASVRAYIEPVVDNQKAVTLPRLLLHFSKSVAVVEIRRVDTDRGLLQFKVAERLQGAERLEEVRISFLVDGQVPEALRKREFKAGQRAVFFGEDAEGQSFVYFEGLWCHAILRDESGWRRLVGIRPLYNGCFSGSVDELVVALERLVMGREAVVRCLPDRNGQAALVRYTMSEPERKTPAGNSSDDPPLQEAPEVDPAKARELREKELDDLHRKMRQLRQREGEESPRMRELSVELWKRQEGLETEQQRAERMRQNMRREIAELGERIGKLQAEIRQANEAGRRDAAARMAEEVRQLERERERLRRNVDAG
ncbi:MAG: hypothetical protein HYS13_21215 [Planctomycetia bacterium]|nr:hypothetical protein [Planctomycetia bacterium]